MEWLGKQDTNLGHSAVGGTGPARTWLAAAAVTGSVACPGPGDVSDTAAAAAAGASVHSLHSCRSLSAAASVASTAGGVAVAAAVGARAAWRDRLRAAGRGTRPA